MNKMLKYCILVWCVFVAAISSNSQSLSDRVIESIKKSEILRADSFLNENPVTVTASYCKRSSGEINDFYSEGDYW